MRENCLTNIILLFCICCNVVSTQIQEKGLNIDVAEDVSDKKETLNRTRKYSLPSLFYPPFQSPYALPTDFQPVPPDAYDSLSCSRDATCTTMQHCVNEGGIPTSYCNLYFYTGICCVRREYCKQVSNADVAVFQNPNYPQMNKEPLNCVFTLNIKRTTCGVRVDFVEAVFAPVFNDACFQDVVLILNGNKKSEGYNTPFCGEIDGYSTVIMTTRQTELKIVVNTQNPDGSFWNIKLTQVNCSALQLPEEDACGIRNRNLDLNATVLNLPAEARNGRADGPNVQNPAMQYPPIQNPAMQNPVIQNPPIQNPAMQNPPIQNPAIQNPGIQNPNPIVTGNLGEMNVERGTMFEPVNGPVGGNPAQFQEAQPTVLPTPQNIKRRKRANSEKFLLNRNFSPDLLINSVLIKDEKLNNESKVLPSDKVNKRQAAPETGPGQNIPPKSEMTQPNQYPWMAAILLDGVIHCSGALISKHWILTAAHCVVISSPSPSSTILRLRVILGAHDINNVDEFRRVMSSVSMIVRHPQYQEGRYDIALLKLTMPVPYSVAIRPACLPQDSDNEFSKTEAIIAGWGSANGLNMSSVLNMAVMPILNTTLCSQTWERKNIMIDDNMLCAGYNGSASCSGDIGGPLVVEQENGLYSVIGILSFGAEPACSGLPIPDVFTRVKHFLDWISIVLVEHKS